MYYELHLTPEEYDTIYTALRLERERNYGGDADVVKLLTDAMEALRAAELGKECNR